MAAVLSSAEVLAEQWWNANWRCRREVVFPQGTDARVFEAAFSTHGTCRADGGDVRVVTGGSEVPSRVLSVGPGDVARVLFERRGERRHFLYWNNPAAAEPHNTSLRAGCLLEVRSYDGGEVNSLDEMRRRWQAAAAGSQGLRFVPNVFFGYNPLGSNKNFLSRFVGYLRCERGGRYLFATDSDDASFVLVDGRLVTQWPGAHGGSARARHTGHINLSVGVHVLEYLHAQGGGGLLMTAAWRSPGASRIEVIPAGAFVPVGEAVVRHIERSEGGAVPDFLPSNTGQAVLDPDGTDYIIKMHFENLVPQTTLAEHTCRWFFGDGTTTTKVSPDHVYLAEGDYDVSLVLVKGYDEKKVTMKVRAERDWSRQAGAIDLREHYYDIVRTYDVSRMAPQQAYRAMYYFERIARRDDVIRAGKVILSRANGLPEETLFDAVKLLAEAMRVQTGEFKEARAMLLAWEKRMKSPEHAAALALAAGDIDMWHLKDLEAAEAGYRRVVFTYAEKARRLTLRKALVRMGDIYRWRHDGEKAREFLHRAQSIAVDERGPVQRAVRAGFLARSIEEFLKTGEMQFAYEYLVTWAWEFPEDQLDGYWTELRVKWLLRNKEYAGGIAEVESLLKMNPKTPYAPSLLWLAADCAEATGEVARAVKLLERVLTGYPEALNKRAVLRRLEALRKTD